MDTADIPDHWRDAMAADVDLFNIQKRVLIVPPEDQDTVTITPAFLDQLQSMAEAATPGLWDPGHLCEDDMACNCPWVFSQTCFGAVCEILFDNGLPISEGGNDNPPLEQAKANQRYIGALGPEVMLEIIRLAKLGLQK